MINEKSASYSIGFLEGFLETTKTLNINGAEAAQEHLKIVETSYNEYRLILSQYQKLFVELKVLVDKIS